MLIVLVIFLSRLLSPVDFRSEEMTRANQLLADLSWRIPNYDNYIIDPIVEISEEMQVIYDLLDEAERERFNYSIAAFYEDWYDMNVAKQKYGTYSFKCKNMTPSYVHSVWKNYILKSIY